MKEENVGLQSRIAVLKDHHEKNIIDIKVAKERHALKMDSFEAEYSTNGQDYSLLQDKYDEILSRKTNANQYMTLIMRQLNEPKRNKSAKGRIYKSSWQV